jgi:MFS family permease
MRYCGLVIFYGLHHVCGISSQAKFPTQANVLFSTFTCISIVPIAGHIIEDLNGGVEAKSAAVMLVTIWELGEAIGPFFIAPLSEMFGRYRLYLTMNTMFLMTILFAALSPSTELLIVSRALMGISVASNVLNPAIVGDMFIPEQRGTAVSLIMFIPLIGGTVGPVFSGVIVQSLGWRTIIWISFAMASICQLFFFLFFRETYKVQILKQKAMVLQSKKGSSINNSEKDTRAKLELNGLRDSIMRPIMVLYDSSVLGALLLFGSFIFAHFYIVSTTLPDILEKIYGLSPTATGLAFIANGESAASIHSISVRLPANLVTSRPWHSDQFHYFKSLPR